MSDMIHFVPNDCSLATIMGSFGMFLILLFFMRAKPLSSEKTTYLFLADVVCLVYMTIFHLLVLSDEVEDIEESLPCNPVPE